MSLSEYPKYLRHPAEVQAVLSVAAAQDMPGGPYQGRPPRFPPVIVNNPDQEAQYVAKGYQPGTMSPEQHMPLIKQPPPHHKERENIRMRELPKEEPPGETYEYPKWVGDKIAKNAKEEAAILAEMAESMPEPVAGTSVVDDAELAEFRAWKAARARGSSKHEPVKRELTEEQKQRRRDNLAKARAARKFSKIHEAAE